MKSKTTQPNQQALGPVAWSVLAVAPALSAAEARARTRMGVGMHSYGFRYSPNARAEIRFKDALDFLEHCHQLGAGGVQASVGAKDGEFISTFRKKTEAYQMYCEGQLGLPRDEADLARFENEVRASREAGVTVLRTVLSSGRRYETYDSAQSFRQLTENASQMLALAEPIAKKHRVRLAIENHKDWRVPEMLDLLKRISSEQVGVCVDFGNSIALLEEPMEVVTAYAPFAFSTHVKDMGVQEYEDGFLLSEVPLGEGFLDLRTMIEVLRRANPHIRFNLEMITRDPLKVPCLTEKYWATFGTLPARHLADTLAMVKKNATKQALPKTTGLSQEAKLKLEDDHVIKCLAYARENLGL